MKVISVFFKTLFIGFIFSCTENIFLLNNVKSFENIKPKSTNNEGKNIDRKSLDKIYYLIDSGDELKIDFVNLVINLEGTPEYTNIYKVRSDGSIFLPEIGNLFVSGLTMLELEKLLMQKYQDYMYDQKISVSIEKYRNISFYLGGQVKKPGLYVFSPAQSDLDSNNQNYSEVKLFDALKKGQGLTTKADLSNIEIIRKNSNSNGGGKIFTNINLLSLLETGDQSVNIRILDGDYIKVKKSDKLIKDQISFINKTNLTPDTINTYIIGNVRSPGSTFVRSGASLYEAIAAAGGANSQVGKIELLRFGENGKPEKKVILNRPKSFVKSKNNPEILDGDIITIRRNLLGKTTAALQEITSPFLSGYGLYSIFD